MSIRQSQLRKQRNDQRPQSDQQQIATTGRTESACANQTGDNAAQQNCAISNENQSGAAYDHSLSIPSLFGRGSLGMSVQETLDDEFRAPRALAV